MSKGDEKLASHTPGPWHRNIKPARKYPTIWAGRNTHVAAIVPGHPWGSGNNKGMSDEELEANINLIAAAPDMYEALKKARVAIATWSPAPDEPLEVIDAAIAKAEAR
jgi:hypothetical protein